SFPLDATRHRNRGVHRWALDGRQTDLDTREGTDFLRGVDYISCHIHLVLGEDRPAESDAYLCTQCIEKLQDLLQDIAEIHERISDVEFLVGTRDKTYQQWMGSKAP